MHITYYLLLITKIKYLVCQFADGTLSARGLEAEDMRDGKHFGAGVGRAGGKPYGSEQVEVVDVIAYEAHVFQSDAQLAANLLCRLQLRLCSFAHLTANTHAEVLQAQFLGAKLHDRRVLAGEDAAGDAGFLQADNPHTIIDAEAFHLLAVGSVVHAAVCQATVHIR